MKKKYKYIILAGIIILIFYSGFNTYSKFRRYKSKAVVSQIDNWWLHIDRFYSNNNRVPNMAEFSYFAKNDSFIIENFPELIPSGLDESDFIITTDSISYFEVWLFSNVKSRKDTLLYSDFSFIDFLLKKSILVIKAPLRDLDSSFPDSKLTH